MFHLILYEPEIPPNTGNIIRLCANTGTHLHLIEPLGFSLDDKQLRRAGLDYREFANMRIYKNFNHYIDAHHKNMHSHNTKNTARIFACSTKSEKFYTQIPYEINDTFLFGPETRGLPNDILNQFEMIRIPMRPDSRSLNLANSVAVILYEAYRQLNFKDLI